MNVCSNSFIDRNKFWLQSRPHPSDCFLYSIYTFPCALLWLSSLPYLLYIWKTRRRPLRCRALNKLRIIFLLVMMIAAIVDLGKSIHEQVSSSRRVDLIYFISPAIVIGSLIFSLIIMLLERAAGVITSPVNFVFHLVMLFASVINAYAAIADAFDKKTFTDLYRFLTMTFFLAGNVGLLVSLCFSDYDPFTADHDPNICELASASVLSQITFHWVSRLVYASFKKDMQQEDIFRLRKEDEVALNYGRFQRNWEERQAAHDRHNPPESLPATSQIQETDELSPIISAGEDAPQVKVRRGPPRPHLFKVLCSVFGPAILFAWAFKLVFDVLNFVNPLILRLMIDFTADRSQPVWHGVAYAVVYILGAILASVCFHQCFHHGLIVGLRTRSALTAAIYRKALRMSNEARGESTVGEIVNLMSVDAQRICDVQGYFWFTWSTLVSISICIALLWNELEAAVLAGVAVLIILMPINGVVMSKLQAYEEKEMEWKDKRVKLLTEVLSGMKILKLYAWEPSYQQRIDNLRKTELSYTQKVSFGWVAVVVVWSMAPYIVMLASFAAYIYATPDRVLTAQRTFVSLTLFNMLRFPMVMLPWGISSSINAYVSLKRINKFLNADDLEKTAKEHRPASEDGPAVSVQNGTFAWTKEGTPILQQVTLDVPKGQLVAVVGRVGCGKSSLISAVLGEMHKVHGLVVTRGSIAYVSQQAWIQHMSLESNILFGQEMDRIWYEKVIDSCALRPDLKLLRAGDQTEIGERGINLSGGQKQRVSLARAVYGRADVYLLDDPLSAVDAHVGKSLFENVIGSEGLLAGKTRILVTHGLQFLPMVDLIVVMRDGRVSECGTYEELSGREDSSFAQWLNEEIRIEEEKEKQRAREDSESTPIAVVSTSFDTENLISSSVGSNASSLPSDRLARFLSHQMSTERRPRSSPVPELSESVSSRSSTCQMPPGNEDPVANAAAEEEETLETGSVSWRAYLALVRARGFLLTTLMVGFYMFYAGLNIGANIWLSEWSDDPLLQNITDSAARSAARGRTDYYMGFYGLFGGLQVIFILGFAFVEAISCIRASRILHNDMLARIMKAPMAFFDITPVGRIINRFSKDMDSVDHELPGNINDFIECSMAVISSVIVVSISTPFFLIAVLPLALIYVALQTFYIPISRQARRLDSVTRSPIFTHFTESIVGAPVIRAFGQTTRFFATCDARVDLNARFFFVKVASNRWLGLRLEVLACFVIFAAMITAVAGRDTLKAGVVGLSISYALQVTDNLNWMVRQITEIETNAVAVERIQEYSKVDQEADWERPDTEPSPSWPSAGLIKFRNYSTRYRPGLDLVLRGITVDLRPGERIGIVGRTGAGKSSLTLALFRLIEAAGGEIHVDRVPISNLGLHCLRGRLTILPQDPILFSGSLRDNLDPFEQYNDDAVWLALAQAHLADWVRSQPDELAHEVGEGGANLSVGQRQLVCLARALLRRSRVLVLDEATAAVDVETDRLVMDTVREQFRDSTTLIIAHRLATILDTDKVMVMDKGQIGEFDAPANLLKKKEGLFYQLAVDAGLAGDDGEG